MENDCMIHLIQPLVVLVSYGVVAGLAFIAKLDYRSQKPLNQEQ